MVPLAQFLESNVELFRSEAEHFMDFDELSLGATAQESWPSGAWKAVALTGRACDRLPQSCKVLQREELRCEYAGAKLVRMRPQARLKPHFGAAPQLQLHLALRAELGAHLSVGNRSLSWQTGEALVIDSSFIRQARDSKEIKGD